ncbi:uncharacterized protein LOC141601433 [Silene latifolia]|uniref:uncharacterized protein LOC141601433 n=1 Tax=Silene latifolia TaxID=37657 RepID=UPI003D78317F
MLKRRGKFAAERNEVINKEVDSLLAADKVREVFYPEWLSNVVVVLKKNGKWRVCVDFTDLNKACPKDPFPLPHIDAMVDATAGHEVLTFLDAWSGYNQIKMHPQDQEKTAFMSKRGEGGKDPVNYISKSPLPAETRYTSFEKLSLALVTASYKLRPYFESHTIHVITNYPLKTIMRKPELSGRMTKWSVHLSGYDLQFEPRTAIKSQALADFVSDFCPATRRAVEEGMLAITGNRDGEIWTLYIDGASNARGVGVGLVLRSPKGDMIVQAIRCEFKATNNEAEYEALILGMQMASGLKVRNLTVYSDSLLVVNHVNNEYVARDPKMIAYLKIATERKSKFRTFKITQVPREQNVKADALATLGSTFQPAKLSNIPITHVLTPAIQGEPDQKSMKEHVHMQCAQGARTLVSAVGLQDAHCRVPYLNWLRDGTLPEDRKEAQSFRIKASRYIMIDNILFRKSLAGPCLRCSGKEEAETSERVVFKPSSTGRGFLDPGVALEHHETAPGNLHYFGLYNASTKKGFGTNVGYLSDEAHFEGPFLPCEATKTFILSQATWRAYAEVACRVRHTKTTHTLKLTQ